MSGNSRADSWRCAFDPNEKLDANTCSKKADALFKRNNIQIWYQFLQKCTPEELIEMRYLESVAFGASKDALAASGAYLDSRFAGKEIADIFYRTLQEIHAEIVLPCGRSGDDEHKVTL